jgi:cytochrome c oxidase subunit 3
MSGFQKHSYHMVDPSPWPFTASLGVFTLVTGVAMYLHMFKYGGLVLLLGVLMVILTMFTWWRDVIREATFEGHHTQITQYGLRMGMILFIVSEVMFFSGFFWAFFHSSLAPTIEIGSIWPPKGISIFSPWDVPLVNTLILLLSGITITWAHHFIIIGKYKFVVISMFATIILALFFTGLQAMEYVEAPFAIYDGIYGSTFYMATGFHGIHVIVGTIFLIVCTYRLMKKHFSRTHHFGFEAAAWYWHFVDVVWLFLFVTVYWWASL